MKEKVYPEIAFGGYSRVDCNIEFYSRIQALLLPGATVLDLGCGRGESTEDPCSYRRGLCDFRGDDRHVIGIDTDDAGRGNPLLDDFRLIEDVAHWPVQDESIDVIVSNSVLEHVERPEEFFSEARRVLRPGGYFCLRTYNKWGYVGICARLAPNRLHSRVLGVLQRERQTHDIFLMLCRCNTPGKVRRALRRQGFQSCAYTQEAEPAYLRFSPLWHRVGAVIHKLIPSPLRWCILSYAHKPADANGRAR